MQARGGDIETITDHRLQKWETTAFVCYPAGPRQNSQYNGADHEDRSHIAVAVLNINVKK